MRVVVDTNVLVSALLKQGGSEARVMSAIAGGKLAWCVSPAILAEYAQVLQRPKFASIPSAYIYLFLDLASRAEIFHAKARMNISSHEEDNRFYECAVAADADFIVTGNRRHFSQSYGRIRIVSARQLIEHIESLG